MADIDLMRYIYWEYFLAVLFLSEIGKALLKPIPNNFVQFISVKEPKWITLIVALFCSVLDFMFISEGDSFHLWEKLISFGLAVLGYDYGFKLIKDVIKAIKNTVNDSGGINGGNS